MRIIFFDATAEEKVYLEKALPEHELQFVEKHLHEISEDAPTAEVVSVFVSSNTTAEALARIPNLKFVATRSTGFDHIDLAACAERGIVVSNVPSYGEHTVAEFAFTLILALSRKAYLGIDRLKETGEFSYDGLEGFDLRDKTIGIVGTGRIGKHVVNMAKGFGMKIVAYDPFPNEALAQEAGFSYVTLDDLLAQSDVVTLHVPYMKETHHLIHAGNIGKMKSTALLINVSRGGLVETEALLQALKAGQLGGAGLDVLEEESAIKDEYEFLRSGHPDAERLKTIVQDHELMRLPNVLITPHMAFDTKEGVERILKTTVENIQAFAAGQPTNTVK